MRRKGASSRLVAVTLAGLSQSAAVVMSGGEEGSVARGCRSF